MNRINTSAQDNDSSPVARRRNSHSSYTSQPSNHQVQGESLIPQGTQNYSCHTPKADWYSYIDENGNQVCGYNSPSNSFKMIKYADGTTYVEEHSDNYHSEMTYKAGELDVDVDKLFNDSFSDFDKLFDDVFKSSTNYSYSTNSKGSCLGCLVSLLFFIFICFLIVRGFMTLL